MEERPLSAIVQPNIALRIRGVSPASPPRTLRADEAGGIMDVVQVHSDPTKQTSVGIQFAGQGGEQVFLLPSGPGGRIHLNDHLA